MVYAIIHLFFMLILVRHINQHRSKYSIHSWHTHKTCEDQSKDWSDWVFAMSGLSPLQVQLSFHLLANYSFVGREQFIHLLTAQKGNYAL